LILARNGLGLLPVTLPRGPFEILAVFAGLTLSAFLVTAVVAGEPAVRRLLRRYVEWRVGIRWYLIAIFGQPVILVLAASLVLRESPAEVLVRVWPLLFSVFLPAIPAILLFGQLWEEVGWRGFALPRLQPRVGPLLATVIVGALQGVWHLPGFFYAGGVSEGSVQFSLVAFLGLVLSAVVSSVLFTWLFNNTRGSLLIIMLFHTVSIAFNRVVFVIVGADGGPYAGTLEARVAAQVIGLGALAVVVIAFLLIVLTRGRLSYKPGSAECAAGTTHTAESPLADSHAPEPPPGSQPTRS
jgi:membrane protease YdiL (CAAX protease family)